MQPSYSIIIPHYNIPSLLRRCLDSIPHRDDIQVIVVDDKSREEDLLELKSIESSYPSYIFIYMSVNGGGGKARNIGLNQAEGHYIIFADADDFFNDCFSSILDDYIDKDYDQIFFKASSVDTETYALSNRADHLNRYIDNYLCGKDPNASQLRYLFGEPWSRMVKRSFIEKHHIRFEETIIHNDTAFGYLTGYYSEHIWADSRPLYCVTTRQGSVSVTTSVERIMTRIAVFSRAEKFLRQNNIETIPNAHYAQLAKLVRYLHFSYFNQGVNVMLSLGFSRAHIYRKVSYKLWRMFKYKFYKS